ncbi:unnamed protein product [Adineta ricciae]|uniref:Uncharacterized protein n=1 Tax=Adineta ricciae TaxID=249248 RepID=A0A814KDM6_ADIRI|nr:unnamed protein product [Adineta ricciae]CAF1315249.1 unnamed protein product [Adineta ricciae]
MIEHSNLETLSIVWLDSSHDATKTYAKAQPLDVRMPINDRLIVVIAGQQQFESINRVKSLVHVLIIYICPNIQR